MKTLSLTNLRKEMEVLKKKIFIYETLQAEKEIKDKKVKGPFNSGKEVLKTIKSTK